VPTRSFASVSGSHTFVNSGADSLSQRVRPNQNVGRSWKFQVAPCGPLLRGCFFGSLGSVTVYVMSLPEPGTSDLKRTDGSSCPT
jgi:hypothetical protein